MSPYRQAKAEDQHFATKPTTDTEWAEWAAKKIMGWYEEDGVYWTQDREPYILVRCWTPLTNLNQLADLVAHVCGDDNKKWWALSRAMTPVAMGFEEALEGFPDIFTVITNPPAVLSALFEIVEGGK